MLDYGIDKVSAWKMGSCKSWIDMVGGFGA